MASQRYLEKKFGRSPSPRTKQQRELPIYRLPGPQFGMDPDQGAKFYLQDVLSSILQKHKVRSFEELTILARPYHIEIKLDGEGDTAMEYIIFDKSGYGFLDRELGQGIRMDKHLDIFGNGDGPIEIHIHSRQLVLEIRKLIRESMYNFHAGSAKQHGLFSERISAMNLKDILPSLKTLERYRFLSTYLP